MTEPLPATNAAAAGDAEDEVQAKAKSAEDRKAAAAMASMDNRDDEAGSNQVDQEAVSKAMQSLTGTSAPDTAEKKEVKKVKIEAADVALLVDQLDLPKPRATELLKAHDGDAGSAMKAFIAA